MESANLNTTGRPARTYNCEEPNDESMHWLVSKALKILTVKLLELAIGRAVEETRDRLR